MIRDRFTKYALWLLAAFLFGLLLTSCAGKQTPLQVATVSHDTLALAQDIEAQLCWGVADAYHAPPDKTHCTSPTAATIGLTDARHQALNAKLAQAFALHKSLTAVTAAGTKADYTTLNGLLADALAIVASLQQTGLVPSLSQAITASKQ